MIFRKLLIAAAASLVPLAAPAIAQNTAQPTLRAGAAVACGSSTSS